MSLGDRHPGRLPPLVFFACLLFAAVAHAETLFEMDFSWDKERVTLGDEINLEIKILRGKDYRLKPLDERLKFSPFEVKSIRRLEPKKKNGGVEEGFRVTLTVFRLGNFVIPEFPVKFVSDEGLPGQVLTEAVSIEVIPVERLASDTDDIRPIKGIFRFQPNMDPVQLIAWGLPLFALFLIAIYVLRRFLIKRGFFEENLTPLERAMRSVTRLEQQPLTGPGPVREFCYELSHAVRRFFADAYQAGSTEQTTREFLTALEEKALEARIRDNIKDILQLTDIVKFANITPPVSDLKEILASARKVFESSEPKEESGKGTVPCPPKDGPAFFVAGGDSPRDKEKVA